MIELKRSFRDQCGSSYREMCQLLARGILMSEPTQRARSKKLESLGFRSVEETEARLDINQVLTVFSVGVEFSTTVHVHQVRYRDRRRC